MILSASFVDFDRKNISAWCRVAGSVVIGLRLQRASFVNNVLASSRSVRLAPVI